MTNEYQVHILRNPYAETIPDQEFAALLDSVIEVRAADIEERNQCGEYPRNRMSFTILDPTAPNSAPADDIVLAIATIGQGGDFFAPNAMAKAFGYRDHGADGAVIVGTQNHRVADGAFRFGGAVEIAGTIVGGSGQTPLQDCYQSTLLAADFNYRVTRARSNWEKAHGPGRWYLVEQTVPSRFARIVDEVLRTRTEV